MSEAFIEKVFGDSAPTNVGSGWISGVLGVFFGLLGFGGALILHFPDLLTLPDARAHYPIAIMRLLIQGTIASAFVCSAISAILRQRKVLALTGGLLPRLLLKAGPPSGHACVWTFTTPTEGCRCVDSCCCCLLAR